MKLFNLGTETRSLQIYKKSRDFFKNLHVQKSSSKSSGVCHEPKGEQRHKKMNGHATTFGV